MPMSSWWIRAFGFFCLATTLSQAGKPSPPESPDEMPPPRLHALYKPSPTQKNSQLKIQLVVAKGWHINTPKPADEFLFPLKLTTTADGVQFGAPKFPKPDTLFFEVLGIRNPIYHDSIEISVPVQKIKDGGKKEITTRVSVQYQACSHSLCLAPDSVVINVKTPLKGG